MKNWMLKWRWVVVLGLVVMGSLRGWGQENGEILDTTIASNLANDAYKLLGEFKFDDAFPLIEEAEKIHLVTHTTNTTNYCLVLYCKAHYYRAKNHLPKSLKLLEEAQRICISKWGYNSMEYVRYLRESAVVYHSKMIWNKAATLYEEELELRLKLGQAELSKEVILCYSWVAWSQFYNGNLKRAIDVYENKV
ncbi:MAG: hypothetical protein IT258_15180, partial [Saprospiraceae bacterium]|nr:hypothetical protein [Saprospiraceae bacterium]